MLALSFALNVAALRVPFLEMNVAIGSDSIYSLPRSVKLMWDAELYVIAVLVVAFSVCFPFLKLLLLWLVWRGGMAEARAGAVLRFVERWGKWSMLDVYIVGLLLALTDDQVFVSTVPLIGLPCFMAAIVLSMLAGELTAARVLGRDRRTVRARRPWLLALATLAHVTAVLAPLLVIDSFWLSDHSLSIVGMASALGRAGWAAWAPALGAALFLVLAPLLWVIARWRGSAEWTARLQRFSMLDVFVLALSVFLLEGDAFVPTKLSEGALYLAGSLLLFLTLQRAAGVQAAEQGAQQG